MMFRRVQLHHAYVVRKLGRRGSFLIMFGGIWIVYGLAILVLPDVSRFEDVPFVGPIVDSGLWGLVWAGCGMFGIWSAYRRPHNPAGADRLGFNAILIPPMIWTAFYALSFLAGCASAIIGLFVPGGGGSYGQVSSWIGIVVWMIAVTVTLLIADWPDPLDQDRLPPQVRRGGE